MTDWSAPRDRAARPSRTGTERAERPGAGTRPTEGLALLLVFAAAFLVASGIVAAFTPGHVADRFVRFAVATQGANALTGLLVIAAVLLVRAGTQRRRSGAARVVVVVGILVAACVVAAGGYVTVMAFTSHPVLSGSGLSLGGRRLPGTIKASTSLSGLAVLAVGVVAAWFAAGASGD